MVCYINKKGGGLDSALKPGVKMSAHHFQGAAMRIGENFVSEGEYSTAFTEKFLRLNNYFVLSKSSVQFLVLAEELGLCKEVTMYGYDWFMFEITPETLELSSYIGIPFGASPASKMLGLPARTGEWRDALPDTQINVYHYGNEFNGFATYSPSEEFKEITLADSVGDVYRIVYIPSNVSGGRAEGYKGGFKNIPV